MKNIILIIFIIYSQTSPKYTQQLFSHNSLFILLYLSYQSMNKINSFNLQLKNGSLLDQTLRSQTLTQQLERQTYQLDRIGTHKGQQTYRIASCLNCCGKTLICLTFCFPCIFLCFKSPFYHQNTSNYGLLQNFGRYTRILNPGLNIINPITQNVIQISRKTRIIQINQPILTKDNVSCGITTILFFRVIDPVKLAFLLGVETMKPSIRQIGYASVRNVAGQQIFQDLLQKRGLISEKLKNYANSQLNQWGIYIEQMLIKDIILNKQLQNILQSVAKTKQSQAGFLISSKAAVQTSKCYANVGQILNTKAAYQIRYLNLINDVCVKNNSKIILLQMNKN